MPRMADPPKPTVLCCPNCGNEEVGSNDTISATAHGQWVVREGKPYFEGDGWTDVCWDSQTNDDENPAFCTNCANYWKLEELVPKDYEEDED